MSSFHIRPASTAADDGLWLLQNLDSQLPWLATVGSGAQWGSEPRSTKEESRTRLRAQVRQSEEQWDLPFSKDWMRAYVAEAEATEAELSAEQQRLAREVLNGKYRIPVAGMILAGRSLEYVQPLLPEQDERDPFLYLAYLLSDRRTSPLSTGAGAALLQHAKEEASRLGISRICGDCWRGNDRRLVKYVNDPRGTNCVSLAYRGQILRESGFHRD